MITIMQFWRLWWFLLIYFRGCPKCRTSKTFHILAEWTFQYHNRGNVNAYLLFITIITTFAHSWYTLVNTRNKIFTKLKNHVLAFCLKETFCVLWQDNSINLLKRQSRLIHFYKTPFLVSDEWMTSVQEKANIKPNQGDPVTVLVVE